MDYRSMYDREYVGAWDLPGDATVEIVKVDCKELNNGKSKNKKPVLWFKGKDKAFVCNKTNGKIIAGLYGNDMDKWIGKKITLYATTTNAMGETVDCIRIRNVAPKGRAMTDKDMPPPAEPGSEG